MCAACTTTFCHGGALMPYCGNDWLALTQEPTLEPELPICDPHDHFWDFRTDRIPYQRYLVWSKNSCSLTLVVFQQAPKPFTTLHWTLTRCAWADHREEQDIALALMIPLVMIMLDKYLGKSNLVF